MKWSKIKWKVPENRLGFVLNVCINFFIWFFWVCISASVPFIGSDSRFCHVRQKPYIYVHTHTPYEVHIYTHLNTLYTVVYLSSHSLGSLLLREQRIYTHTHILHCLFFFYIFSFYVYLSHYDVFRVLPPFKISFGIKPHPLRCCLYAS